MLPEQNGYLIPANSKNGKLIFNYFRPIDLGIFAGGIGISLLLLMIFKTGELFQTILILLPGFFAAFLVAPIPHHHNMMVFISSIYKFFTGRRNYIWKGWCFKDGDDIK